MKKLVFFIFIITIWGTSLAGWTPEEYQKYQEHEETLDYQVIPDEAIRLRILANSDQEEDQQIKHKVRDEVNEVISSWVAEITDIGEARELIQERLPEIDQLVEEVLQASGENREYTVDYDSNITFPMKLYGDYLYPPGEYEAILITLGEGDGSNWWCVLFPPLCFLDFSFGTTVEAKDGEPVSEPELEEEEAEEETEVKFFLFEWLGWS
ncbi:stage II sporulation protein R [Oceanobacillus alkalisoli]|uniref:stage II sporulation protein R n=1 Tax=Oceanobacillus alkalisoli TaxID=2925113 RepID=UPI001EF05C57|nr:stage II sporulation protein R [Oceanobacillus alkalisoli]MCF3942748.1 stage II sporulation protein R [Oceanobacillus alkalisoli]MCG5102719.1 stage II sporulation protein R [Oceanobacillus alkalisoli]